MPARSRPRPSASVCAPSAARRSCSWPPVSARPIACAAPAAPGRCRARLPSASGTTPVSRSPARIARWIGAAPRQRGSSEACTFQQPSRGMARIASRQDQAVGDDHQQVRLQRAQRMPRVSAILQRFGLLDRDAAQPALRCLTGDWPRARVRGRRGGRAGCRRPRLRGAAPAARSDGTRELRRAGEHDPQRHAEFRVSEDAHGSAAARVRGCATAAAARSGRVLLALLLELLAHQLALERRQVIDEQLAFQVIHLVLDADRQQAVGLAVRTPCRGDPAPARVIALGARRRRRRCRAPTGSLPGRPARRRVAVICGLTNTSGCVRSSRHVDAPEAPVHVDLASPPGRCRAPRTWFRTCRRSSCWVPLSSQAGHRRRAGAQPGVGEFEDGELGHGECVGENGGGGHTGKRRERGRADCNAAGLPSTRRLWAILPRQ